MENNNEGKNKKKKNGGMYGIPATNDYAFKQIFGNTKEPDILKSFINATLRLEGENQVQNVGIIPPEELPIWDHDKAPHVNILARDMKGKEFIVEIQALPPKSFMNRMVMYVSRQLALQGDRAKGYPRLKKVYLIIILDFALEESNDYITKQVMMDQETGLSLMTHMELCVLELPKFTKEEISRSDSLLEKWMHFLKYTGEKRIDLDALCEDEFKKAIKVLDRISSSKTESSHSKKKM